MGLCWFFGILMFDPSFLGFSSNLLLGFFGNLDVWLIILELFGRI